MRKAIITIVLLVVAAVIGWVIYRFYHPSPVPPPPTRLEKPQPQLPSTPQESRPQTQAPEETPGEAQAPPEPETQLPPLAESDDFVQTLITPMNLPQRWTEQGDYVRRLAVLAENATRGKVPRRQLAFMAPKQSFQVIHRDGNLYVDPASYDRYDHYVQTLEAVDPARLASVLKTINPLMQEALSELGVEGASQNVYQQAISQVLAVPVLPGNGSVEVVQPNVLYQYADPKLESLSSFEKQILRMGPENVQRLQSYVRRLAQQMNLQRRA